MKVFISWSGDLSRELAQALRDWLPRVLQRVEPYFSLTDLEAGGRWSDQIASELEDTSIGLFLLTSENLNSPWMVFEAGAISKVVKKGRVCTILFGLTPTDVTGPLSQFQATLFNEESIAALLVMMNGLSGERKMSETDLQAVIAKWWPELEAEWSRIINARAEESPTERRADRNILDEILSIARYIRQRIDEINAPRTTASHPKSVAAPLESRQREALTRILADLEADWLPSSLALLLGRLARQTETPAVDDEIQTQTDDSVVNGESGGPGNPELN